MIFNRSSSSAFVIHHCSRLPFSLLFIRPLGAWHSIFHILTVCVFFAPFADSLHRLVAIPVFLFCSLPVDPMCSLFLRFICLMVLLRQSCHTRWNISVHDFGSLSFEASPQLVDWEDTTITSSICFIKQEKFFIHSCDVHMFPSVNPPRHRLPSGGAS